MRDEDRHLRDRDGKWYYVRRIPVELHAALERTKIEKSLRTESLESARIRRDAMEDADDALWSTLLADESAVDLAWARYKADQKRCMALGFKWRSLDQLIDHASPEELVARILPLRGQSGKSLVAEADALLGAAEPPKVKISEALKVYLKEIAPDVHRGQSAKQVRTFNKVKNRAVSNFIHQIGDLAMIDITRDNALKFHRWWQDRVTGKIEPKMSPNSGNRDLGNVRKLYADYFRHIGEEDRPNPFRNLRFRERLVDKKKRPPFETAWIRDRILKKEALAGLNREALMIMLAMIETGCRPSELANIPGDHIHLDAEVPFIEIDFQEGRELKTESSIRRIPLVGISLQAMRRAPDGFPRYLDKEDNFSQVCRKHFRVHGLFPSEDHVIYSLRHSFEKRMTEAGIDSELRRLLMGHAIDRPDYGDGGSLEYRRGELEKMVLPYPDDLFEGLS